MKIKETNVVLSYLLLLSVTVNLVGAFAVSKSPEGMSMIRRNARRNTNHMELNLFRSHQSHYRCNNDDHQYSAPNSIQEINRVPKMFKRFRLFISVRFSLLVKKYKKRYISILAAAMLTAGSFPCHSIAQTSANTKSVANVLVTNVRTSMDSEIKKSIAKNSFLQYDTKAPNNYFEDFDVNNFFDTNIQITSENNVVRDKNSRISIVGENSNGDELVTALVGDTVPFSIGMDAAQIQEIGDEYMYLDDTMVKSALRNVAVVSSGTAGLIALRRKVARMNFEEADKDDSVHVDVQDKHGMISRAKREQGMIGKLANLRPRLKKKHVEARKQPKSPKEEAFLAARYAAIPTLEERAYQVLVDLGMI